jgi:hypothetical protein
VFRESSLVPDHLLFLFRELREYYDDGWWWRHHLLEVVNNSVNAAAHALHPGLDRGVRVMERDWDNLVVLDACRADLFEQVVDVEVFDAYERVTSRGSMTPEWTRRNFADGEFGDTVYVSANPHTALEAGDSFHRLVSVWQSAFDEEWGTVPPAAVADAAAETVAEFPAKRRVVHFLQPHHPFVGDEETAAYSGWTVRHLVEDDHPRHPHDPFEAYSMGLVGRDVLWDAYADTLSLVLDHALALARELPGRTVVTSDHGNMVGERGWPVPTPVYGHHPRLRYEQLVDVPWAVVAAENRPRIAAGSTADAGVGRGGVRDRLRQLGYA